MPHAGGSPGAAGVEQCAVGGPSRQPHPSPTMSLTAGNAPTDPQDHLSSPSSTTLNVFHFLPRPPGWTQLLEGRDCACPVLPSGGPRSLKRRMSFRR